MVRDVLVGEIPTVLRSDLYAVAELVGAVVVVAGHLLQLPPMLTTLGGVIRGAMCGRAGALTRSVAEAASPLSSGR